MNSIRLAVFLLVISIFIIPCSSLAGSGYVAKNLAQAQFTTRIKGRMPLDNLSTLSTKFKKIFFFTNIRDCEDCDIQHRWWHKGNEVSVVESKTTSSRYRWWTNKTLNNSSIGEWTVKVYVDDDHIYSKSFTYYKPSIKQQNKVPVQKRLLAREADECELQLRYYSDKVKEDEKEPYFEFMLKTWGKRCLGE